MAVPPNYTGTPKRVTSPTGRMENSAVRQGRHLPGHQPLMPPPSTTVGSSNPKICGVCGDRAKSFHFGGLSCDSCKAFFRRSVQNDAYKNFQCSYEGHCVITLSTRKSCQYCRLQRCFSIGMEKGWVMTEQERIQMMKVRQEKKLRLQQQQQQQQLEEELARKEEENRKQQTEEVKSVYEPDISIIGQFLEPEEQKEIEGAVLKYMQAYQQVPYDDDLRYYDEARPGVQIITMFTTLIRRFAFFSRLLPQFAALTHKDQAILLRGGILEMCLLRGALTFDQKTNRWPSASFALYKNSPVLRIEDARKLVSSKLFDMHMDFIGCIKKLNVDEPTIMLLLLVVLFTPERPGLEQVDVVAKHQEYFSNLMRRYMRWRYGPKDSTRIFSNLLTKISDLRELSDSHNRYNLRLAKQEVTEIQQQLGNMNLNPYPEWNLVNTADNPAAAQPQQQQHCLSKLTKSKVPPCNPPTHVPPLEDSNSSHSSSFGSCLSSSSAGVINTVNIEENIGLQFMHAMQKSISQVLSTPHFGYEWVTPAMELGPFPDYDDRSQSAASVDSVSGCIQQPGSEQSVALPALVGATAVDNKVDNISVEQLEHFRQVLEQFIDTEESDPGLEDDVIFLEGMVSTPVKEEPGTCSPAAVDSPFLSISNSPDDYNFS